MTRKVFTAILAGVMLFFISACGKGVGKTIDLAELPTGNQQTDSADDSQDFVDFDDGETISLEDIPDLAWIFAEDDPDEIRLSLRREDDDLAGEVEYPFISGIEFERMRFGALNWLVLEERDGKALLLCERLVDFRPYRYSDEENKSWCESGVRDWLNGRFYDGTFTDEEMARIVETNVVNNDNPWFGVNGGKDTVDNVFLLSIEEVVRYFGDSGNLSNHTDKDVWVLYDDYNDNRLAQYIDGDVNAWWWLRSPGMNYLYSASVSIDGSINLSGDYVVSGGGGVRPAMWIWL